MDSKWVLEVDLRGERAGLVNLWGQDPPLRLRGEVTTRSVADFVSGWVPPGESIWMDFAGGSLELVKELVSQGYEVVWTTGQRRWVQGIGG